MSAKIFGQKCGMGNFCQKIFVGKIFAKNVGGGQKLPLVPKILVGEILAKNVGGAKNYP